MGRCLENEEALNGMAFVLAERSGSLEPAYERDAKGWPEAMLKGSGRRVES